MLLASGASCAHAHGALTHAVMQMAATAGHIGGPSRCPDPDLMLGGVAQSRQVVANARGIHTEIAAAHARYRAYVDAAAAIGRGDTNDDVVDETEPAAALAGLYHAGFRIARDDGPAHPFGGLEGPHKGVGGWRLGFDRLDVGVGLALQVADLGALIDDRVGLLRLPQREDGTELRR